MKEKLSLITLYDTACGSKNSGDQIIMDAVVDELDRMFPEIMKIRYPTHYPLAIDTRKKAWKNKLAFVGGTNLLRNYWRFSAHKNAWSLSFMDAFRMTPAVLMGVGWNRYADTPKSTAKFFYRKALSGRWIHSVRDTYTVDKLRQCGIENVIHTGCPTLWSLTPEKLALAPRGSSEAVVFTLTDHSPHLEHDQELIARLSQDYKHLYFWPQGAGDLSYFKSLHLRSRLARVSIAVLPANLRAFDKFLRSTNVDYVGTRLHAGIRAIQHNRKTMIVAIDNRATEMEKDHQLPVIDRDELGELSVLKMQKFNQDIRVPFERINAWKEQFVGYQLQ